MEYGKKNWIFADGDLPPAGDRDPIGHESLMIVNNNKEEAVIKMDLLFDDKEPKRGFIIKVAPERVRCIRVDLETFGEENYKIPFGQYCIILESNVPVVCCFGRLDRRPDMAFYSQSGYAF